VSLEGPDFPLRVRETLGGLDCQPALTARVYACLRRHGVFACSE
jgi:hypothetical protein